MSDVTLKGVVTITVGTQWLVDASEHDARCEGREFGHEVGVALVGDTVIWRTACGQYIDGYGDGGPDVIDLFAEALIKVLK